MIPREKQGRQGKHRVEKENNSAKTKQQMCRKGNKSGSKREKTLSRRKKQGREGEHKVAKGKTQGKWRAAGAPRSKQREKDAKCPPETGKKCFGSIVWSDFQ